MLIPQHQITSIQSMRNRASPNLLLTGDTLVTGNQINVMFKAIKLVSCDIQRNCIFKFLKITCFSCVYEGILCSLFCEK